MKCHDAHWPWVTVIAAVCFVLLAAPVPATAQETEAWGAHFVRTAHVEGEVTIQRASEIPSEEALLNMPVIPGDRLWTGLDGRAELQLADGMLVRMNFTTKLDTEALGISGDAENDVTVLRLWSGSAILSGGVFDSAAKTLQVDTPAASSFVLEDGLTRIDIAEDGATVVSVYRGLVEVVALNSSVLVRAGQRTVVTPGYAPEDPFTFNTLELDDFGLWSDERDKRHSANYSESYVDDSIAAYTYDLTDYGNWFYVSDYDSYCWRPYVGFGWSPYHYGYWHWYPWGYYWYSWEPWGWACYHYGYWDCVPGYGWAWIPDNRWSGGRVRWGLGSDYVGWAPLDHNGYAATVAYDQSGNQGLAFREGRPLTVNTSDGTLKNIDANSWTFAKPDALTPEGRSGSYLEYDDVTGRQPMKLLVSPLAVTQKEADNPGAAVENRFKSPGYSGGTPEKTVAPSSGLTGTGRRYATTDSTTNTFNSYHTRRSGGSAGVVTRPPSTGSSYSGTSSVPPRSTGTRSYSKQIYNGVTRPSGSSSSSNTSRSRSSIPPRVTRPSTRPASPPSSTRPPSTRSAPPPPRTSTSRPAAPKRTSSGKSVSRPPSRSSGSSSKGSRSAPSRSSGSSSKSSSKGKK